MQSSIKNQSFKLSKQDLNIFPLGFDKKTRGSNTASFCQTLSSKIRLQSGDEVILSFASSPQSPISAASSLIAYAPQSFERSREDWSIISAPLVKTQTPPLELSDVFPQDNKTLFIDEYVSEHSQRITKILADGQDYNISAPTGAGKTYAIIQAALDDKHLKTDKFRDIRLAFCVPYVALCDQIADDFKISGLREGKIFGNELPVVATYNSLINKLVEEEKYRSQLKEMVLVIDEFHHLFIDNSFRGDVIQKLTKSFPLFKKVIRVTGTGEGYFDKSTKTIQFKKRQPCPVYSQVNLLEYEYGSSPIKSLIPLLTQNYAENKIQIVFYNSKAGLRSIKDALINRGFHQDKISILESDDKENNPVYESIIRENKPPDNCEFILTTKLIEDGVSINDERISHVYAVNISNIAELRQMAARPRKNYQCFNILKSFNPQISPWPYYDIEKKFEEEKTSFNNTVIPYLKREYKKYKDNPSVKKLKRFDNIKSHHAELLYNQEEPELNPYALKNKVFQDFQNSTSSTPELFIRLFAFFEEIPEKTIQYHKLDKKADVKPDKKANSEDLKIKILDLLQYDAYNLFCNFKNKLSEEIIKSDYFNQHYFPDVFKKDDAFLEQHRELLKHKSIIKTVEAFTFLENFLDENRAFGLLRHLPVNKHKTFLSQVEAVQYSKAHTFKKLAPDGIKYIIGFDAYRFLIKEYQNNKLERFNYEKLTKKVNTHLSRKIGYKGNHLKETQISKLIRSTFDLKENRIQQRIRNTKKFKRAKLYTATNIKTPESINQNFNLPENLRLEWENFLEKNQDEN